jgi:hypothetical protein
LHCSNGVEPSFKGTFCRCSSGKAPSLCLELCLDVCVGRRRMNRRQHRAAASTSGSAKTTSITSADQIPLSRPQTTTSEAKTLYEIAAERQAKLAPHGQPFPKSAQASDKTKFVKINANGSIEDTPAPGDHPEDLDSGESAKPIFDTVFLALPLSCLHFTLSVLTVHQYAQELTFGPIIFNTAFVAFPTLCLLIHLLHGHLLALPGGAQPEVMRKASSTIRPILFVLTANVAGCYLIHLTNDHGYYAVMKRAPGIGTVWVWSVLELGLAGALGGVIGPGLFAWWNGYGVF